jgi:hypothetical protein
VVVGEAVWKVDWGVLYVSHAWHIARMEACNTVALCGFTNLLTWQDDWTLCD